MGRIEGEGEGSIEREGIDGWREGGMEERETGERRERAGREWEGRDEGEEREEREIGEGEERGGREEIEMIEREMRETMEREGADIERREKGES